MRDLGYNTYMFTATIYTPDGNMMISTELKILVEEEYGYRYWCWTPVEESEEALTSVFEAARKDPKVWNGLYFKDLSKFGGDWKEIKVPEGLTEEEEDDFFAVMLEVTNYNGMATIREDGEDSRLIWSEMY